MNETLIVAGAHIVDPASGFDGVGSLRVENGRIADLVEGHAPGTPEGARVIEATGQYLLPGLIDLRVFTGEPGHEYRETIASAGKAAAAGGVTSFVTMPDTSPVIDDGSLVEFVARRAEKHSPVRVYPSAAITSGLDGRELTEFGLLKEAGASMLTDGRRSIQSSAVLRAAFTYASNFDLPVAHLPLDTALAGPGVMNEGLFATTLGLAGIPLEAETIPLARDLQLAALTGVRYHAAQISCGHSVELMTRARQSRSGISAGVSINNLTLNELDVGEYRTFFKLSPPLRDELERLKVIEGLKSGAISAIHSDHDPQDVEGKRRPFAEAAQGAIGLETLLAAALRLVHSGDADLKTVVRALTEGPAKVLGIPGGSLARDTAADFILVDLEYPWVNSEDQIRSRSQNTAFEGARFTGKVMATYVGGKAVFEHSAAGTQT